MLKYTKDKKMNVYIKRFNSNIDAIQYYHKTYIEEFGYYDWESVLDFFCTDLNLSLMFNRDEDIAFIILRKDDQKEHVTYLIKLEEMLVEQTNFKYEIDILKNIEFEGFDEETVTYLNEMGVTLYLSIRHNHLVITYDDIPYVSTKGIETIEEFKKMARRSMLAHRKMVEFITEV